MSPPYGNRGAGETCSRSSCVSAGDQAEDLLGEGDDDTARDGQDAVRALGRVVALQREAELQDTEAQQDDSDGADQAEDEVAEVVDYRDGIIRRQCGKSKTDTQDDNAERGEQGTDSLGCFHMVYSSSMYS